MNCGVKMTTIEQEVERLAFILENDEWTVEQRITKFMDYVDWDPDTWRKDDITQNLRLALLAAIHIANEARLNGKVE